MLRPRLIPCLLIQNGGLVKTTRFKDPKYVGDPINAVKIFNEKFVDELMLLDIDATSTNQPINYKLIQNIAAECRMPLCYGGGIKSVEEVSKIIGLGVEKVAISSQAVVNSQLISEAASVVGSQSIVVVVDVKKSGLLRRYEVVINNATKRTGIDPFKFVQKLQALGVGEIVINAVDNDGMMQGYDLDLITQIAKITSVPLTVLGGAGKLSDITKIWDTFGLIGAAAGSLFVFKGKYRAVLINYPNFKQKNELLTMSTGKRL